MSLALYIHWPFCVSKCPYCDFNSHVRDRVDQEIWLSALLCDLDHEARLIHGRKLSSIFFGGGTPSLMPPATVAALIARAEAQWGFAPNIEITLEANPSSVEAARFADLATAGINRVSLGLQSLDDKALQFLGRAHSVTESLDALQIAQSHFARVSFDLIYALPEQTEAQWRKELERAISFGSGHLSLYQLTIEEGTRFATLARQGAFVPADDDYAAGLFEITRTMTASAGIPAYEISNHARDGQQSRHNLAYWHYRDYVGIGPGAHGRRHAMATQRHKKPENFLSAVERNGHGMSLEESLDPATRAVEALMMGLRLDVGLDIQDVSQRVAFDVRQALDLKKVEHLQGLGLIALEDDHLTVSQSGMPLLDGILKQIVRTGGSLTP
jgi:putative oxygen-independent coproporphyrinogen III oxidase